MNQAYSRQTAEEGHSDMLDQTCIPGRDKDASEYSSDVSGKNQTDVGAGIALASHDELDQSAILLYIYVYTHPVNDQWQETLITIPDIKCEKNNGQFKNQLLIYVTSSY